MKKSCIKGILAGVLAGAITVCSFPVVANSIETVMNSVNIKLNGTKVASANENYELQNGKSVPFSILYEGTTYLPIRKVSELLSVDIDWENESRTVIIDDNRNENKQNSSYDSWYGAPDFGEFFGIKELAQSPNIRSTTHWYMRDDVKSANANDYAEKLEELGYERVTEGNVLPKFKVYQKDNIQVWLDLGMYTKLVYGVTVTDTTRPIVGREYSYSGNREDIPNFASAFGYLSATTLIDDIYYTLGEWDLWACLPDYLALLEEEGFSVSSINSNYYGKCVTLKKSRSSVVIKFDGTSNSNWPAIAVEY